jgi:hypothetical protein
VVFGARFASEADTFTAPVPFPADCEFAEEPRELKVPHSNHTVVFEPFGFTDALSVAVLCPMPVALSVCTEGAEPDGGGGVPEVVNESVAPYPVPAALAETAR